MAEIIIYGSCVSRDTFSIMEQEHRLLAYVARQSLISAMTQPTTLLEPAKLDSKFQSRMLNGDLKSDLLGTLRKHSMQADLLLIDLTDERLGVHKLPDNSFVTRSSELIQSGLLNKLNPIPGVIQIGTERHWIFWERAASRFVDHLSSIGLFDKTIIVNTPWAAESIEGAPVPGYRNFTVNEMNGHLRRYGEHLKRLGLRVLEMPEELAKSTKNHKWGIAPFHYQDSAYEWISKEIELSLSGLK
jgi:hypothetical protein